MLMHALDVGGLPPVGGSQPGSYELAALDAYGPLEGRAVKLLDMAVSYETLPIAAWRFIWLDRNGHEQASSHRKFIRALGIDLPRSAIAAFERSYVLDRPKAIGALRQVGPVLELSYEYALAEPFAFAGDVADYLPEFDLDVKAMARSIHKRSPKCRPDLSFELSTLSTEGVSR